MQVAHGLRKLGHALRKAFARESLDVDPETPPRTRRARSLARALFAIEDLPEDPPAPRQGRRRDALRALAAFEELPLDPEAPPERRAGILHALFGPERLGEEPPEAPRPRHRWLSWLLVPESLDPPRR